MPRLSNGDMRRRASREVRARGGSDDEGDVRQSLEVAREAGFRAARTVANRARVRIQVKTWTRTDGES